MTNLIWTGAVIVVVLAIIVISYVIGVSDANSDRKIETELSLEAINMAKIATRRIVDQKQASFEVKITREAIELKPKGIIPPSQVDAVIGVLREVSQHASFYRSLQDAMDSEIQVRPSLPPAPRIENRPPPPPLPPS